VALVAVRNVSPLGDLHLPALGIDVAAGGTVTVAAELAEQLLQQSDTWAPADAKTIVKGD
jgi:hypothetical protein